LDLRTNPFQKGGDDGRGPITSPTNRRSGPTTRTMEKKIQKKWDTSTNGKETSQYMFKDAINLV